MPFFLEEYKKENWLNYSVFSKVWSPRIENNGERVMSKRFSMCHLIDGTRSKDLGKKIITQSGLSFGSSTALHPPAHIHKYALVNAPCIRTKIRRNLAQLFFAEALRRVTVANGVFLSFPRGLFC